MAYINIMEAIYPIGTIYLSANSTSPSSLFGGTWVAIDNNKMLRASNSFSTGGSAQLPYHYHQLDTSGYGGLMFNTSTSNPTIWAELIDINISNAPNIYQRSVAMNGTGIGQSPNPMNSGLRLRGTTGNTIYSTSANAINALGGGRLYSGLPISLLLDANCLGGVYNGLC